MLGRRLNRARIRFPVKREMKIAHENRLHAARFPSKFGAFETKATDKPPRGSRAPVDSAKSPAAVCGMVSRAAARAEASVPDSSSRQNSITLVASVLLSSYRPAHGQGRFSSSTLHDCLCRSLLKRTQASRQVEYPQISTVFITVDIFTI